MKDHVARVRPAFLAARSYQRTTYLPGELAHGDWWEPGTRIPVGGGASRKAYGWVTTLPHSAAHAVVFSPSKTMPDLLQATLGCFQRLGGVPEAMVVDNDTSIVVRGVGKHAVPPHVRIRVGPSLEHPPRATSAADLDELQALRLRT